jgi:tektin-4
MADVMANTYQSSTHQSLSSTPYIDPVIRGSVGHDMGMSTVGYRSAKYNPPEWHESNYSKYNQALADRENAARSRNEANDTIKDTEALAQKTQAETTKKLTERLKDENFWKLELEREIKDVISETDVLLTQKKRLENALRATEIPLHIATDNLHCRQRRQGIDLVQDDVELNLLKVQLYVGIV